MKNGFTPIILIVLGIGLFFTFTDAKYKEVKEVQETNAKYITAIQNSNELIKLRDDIVDQYNAFPSESLRRVGKLVPNNIDSVRLIIDINGITSKYGVPVQNVRIDTIKGAPNKETVIADGKIYNTAKLSFTVKTRYETFIKILKDIESSLRILDIEEVSFMADDKSDLYSFDITLRTYWMK
jgi:hypothetical protein